MKRTYLSEVKLLKQELASIKPQLISIDDLLLLPKPVKRYFQYGGYIGKERMQYACVEWKDAYLKTSLQSDWKKIECLQFNAVEAPTRLVYMKSKLFGLFSFEGMDSYINKEGNMKIQMANLFTVADAKGKEMNASELVTILSESLLIPAYALQTYIAWMPIDETTTKATISYNDINVSGLFYFTKEGKLIRFETDDRYLSERGKKYERMKWHIDFRAYRTMNGICSPSFCKAVWHTPKGAFEYFKGRIKTIAFDSIENNAKINQQLAMS